MEDTWIEDSSNDRCSFLSEDLDDRCSFLSEDLDNRCSFLSEDLDDRCSFLSEDLDEVSLLQDGFAGVTEVVGNQVTWHRDFNVRPESFADVDCGLMTFADSEHVREDGLDGSYLEEWERLPESVGPTWGFRLSGKGVCSHQPLQHTELRQMVFRNTALS